MDGLTGPHFLPKGKITSLIVFLHGLGSNGDDLLGLAPVLSPSLPGTGYLAPNAPFRMDRTSGYQWFDYWDRSLSQINDGVRHAAPMIADFVQAAAQEYQLPMQKIILCGFSQGTMMALHAGLRLIPDLGGIIGFSGVLMTPETLLFEKVSPLPPVLLVHGLQDTVVPAAASFQAQIALKALGGAVKYIQRPHLGHSIDDKGIEEAIKFSKNIFAGS
ncbi:MAG: phospholipase/carboxylesterase [Alphaproteobacteria bacterium]|nr:phospholipase/carboxylesterase [Alphaproteobacteria bacterium]